MAHNRYDRYDRREQGHAVSSPPADSRAEEASDAGGVGAASTMEWEASDYRWDAYSMRAHNTADGAADTAVTSGRRTARHPSSAAIKQMMNGQVARMKRTPAQLVCQVPGCEESLVTAKEYHQRYRICAAHAKADSVDIIGVAQRFCQQCGKFHELQEFEGSKRSCRQQLMRHNALRRKAPAALGSSTSITAVAAATVAPTALCSTEGGLLPIVAVPVWPFHGVDGMTPDNLSALASAQQAAAALIAEQQMQPCSDGPKRGKPRSRQHRISPPKTSSAESNTQQLVSNWVQQPTTSGNGALHGTVHAASAAAEVVPAAAAAAAAGHAGFHNWTPHHDISPGGGFQADHQHQADKLLGLQPGLQHHASMYAHQSASTQPPGVGGVQPACIELAAAAAGLSAMGTNAIKLEQQQQQAAKIGSCAVPEQAMWQQLCQQQLLQQQQHVEVKQAGAAVCASSCAIEGAAPNLDSSSEAPQLQELLDDLWAGQAATGTACQTPAAPGSAAAVAAVAAVPGTASAPLPAAAAAAMAGPQRAALDDSGEDPAAVCAVENIMHQLAAQQQLGLLAEPQPQLQPLQALQPQPQQHLQKPPVQPGQQQQQQPGRLQQSASAGVAHDQLLHQSSHSSCISHGSNSSSAVVGQAQDVAGLLGSSNNSCNAAKVPTYTYTGYQAACKVQPGQLSVPIPDELLESILEELGPLAPKADSQLQQQQQGPAKATSADAASGAAAGAAAAAAGATPLLVQQAPSVQPRGTWQGGSRANNGPTCGTGVGASSTPALAAGGISGGAQAVRRNPLLGPLTAAQRTSAASHIRNMSMVAAAAGEAGEAVLNRALQLMELCGDWLPHTVLLQLRCLSVKLLGLQPCELSEDLRDQLIAAVVGAIMPEAFLRPGCCLVSLDYAVCTEAGSRQTNTGGDSLKSRAAAASSAAAAVLERLCGSDASSWFSEQRVRFQQGNSVSQWDPDQQQCKAMQGQGYHEGVASRDSGGGSIAAIPVVSLASSPALWQQDWQHAWLAVSCHGLSPGEQLELSVRGGGQYYTLDAHSITVEACTAASAADGGGWGSWLTSRLAGGPGGAVRTVRPEGQAVAGAGESVLVWFRLAEAPRSGPLRVELTACSTGASGAAVLLVSDDAHLVAELNATYEAGATAAAGLARGVSSSSSAAAVAAQREQQMQALLAELGFALELKAGLLQAYDDSRNAAADAATAPLTSSNSTHSSGGGVGSSDSSSSATHCFAGRQLQHYSSKEVALLVRSARRLVAAAVRAGCPATAAALMPLAGIGVRGPEHLLAAVAAEGCSSLSPEWADAGVLHLAVASQSPHMVSWLLDWGRTVGLDWVPHVTAAGMPGLTPLHLAALLRDPAGVADALTDMSPAAAAAWFGKVLSARQPAATSAAQSSSSSSAAATTAAAGRRSSQGSTQQRSQPAAAAPTGSMVHSSSGSSNASCAEPCIVLLPAAGMRCGGLTPAAVAALVGRVVLNAAVARKVPAGMQAGELLAEAAADAADVAAGREPEAAAAAAALAGAAAAVEDDGPLKPKPLSAARVAGWGPPADPPEPLCPVCQLPLTSFSRFWHRHHNPVHLPPTQQQQQDPQHAPLSTQTGGLGQRAEGSTVGVVGGVGLTSQRNSLRLSDVGDVQPESAGKQQEQVQGAVLSSLLPGSVAGGGTELMSLQLVVLLVAGLVLVALLGRVFVRMLEGQGPV